MAAPVNTGLQTTFQDLVNAIEKRDDQQALQLLTHTAQQLDALHPQHVQSIKTTEQLQIQNTLTTLGQLLDLHKQLNGQVLGELSVQVNSIREEAKNYEKQLTQKSAAMEETINLLTQQNAALKARIEAYIQK